MKNRFIKRKGVTLLEIVISMAIIGIMLIPILGMVTQTVKNTANGQRKQEATLTGQQVFEQIKGLVSNSTSIDAASGPFTIAGVQMSGTANEFKGTKDDFDFNGKHYKVEMSMKKNSYLERTTNEPDDFDGEFLIKDTGANCNIKLRRSGSKVTASDNTKSYTVSKSFDILYSGDNKELLVNATKLISDTKLNGSVLLDFTKYDEEMIGVETISVNVKNLSNSDILEIYVDKIKDKQNIEINLSNDNKGKVKTFVRDLENPIVDDVPEPWNITIDVFKEGTDEKLYSGSVIQNMLVRTK